MAKYFLLGGCALLLIGSLLYFYPNVFKWFGNLPGDIKKGDGNFQIYIPLTSMILISVFISLLIRVIRLFS